ncbi:MAG: STAS domain-containing protein [Alphaproteobacteria bacterium]|nr:STAS domain-containing protein [Alphaproteobacteria bacterium]
MLSLSDDHLPVYFSDDVTILNIDKAYLELSAAFLQEKPVILDISGVTETDLTFVQMIESARRQAAASGRDLVLSRPAEGAVLEVLRRGGFLDDDVCNRAEFWLQEGFQ